MIIIPQCVRITYVYHLCHCQVYPPSRKKSTDFLKSDKVLKALYSSNAGICYSDSYFVIKPQTFPLISFVNYIVIRSNFFSQSEFWLVGILLPKNCPVMTYLSFLISSSCVVTAPRRMVDRKDFVSYTYMHLCPK